ncbi:MAG: hypothetical protein ACFE95_16245 [Candidatus Hodarchaeota archaeon]
MSNGDTPRSINGPELVEDNPYGFYIYFFDEIKGHIPLFAFPSELLTNEHDKRILSIHPIWWHQDQFLETTKFRTIDLELEGVTFAATLLICQSDRAKRRFGMDSLKWKGERFVLIVRAPSTVSFIAHEILYELKLRIQDGFNNDICILVEKNLTKFDGSEQQRILIEKSSNIEAELSLLCQSLIPKVPLSKLEEFSEPTTTQEPESKKLRKLRFSIPTEDKVGVIAEKIVDERPKRVKIINIDHDKQKIRIIIRNTSTIKLKNVLLKIYQSQSFFGTSAHVSTIKEWNPKEDVSIEFKPSTNNSTTYFLRIEDESGIIKLRRILG